MIQEVVALHTANGIDLVAVVYGRVAELSLHVGQLGTELEGRREGGREGGREGITAHGTHTAS